MIIGIPKEIKNHEHRVGITHHGVNELTLNKHEVIVEKGAGLGAGISDEDYKKAGAKLVSVDDVFKNAEMIMKVKEPLESEYVRLQKKQIIFTYLHLAAEKKLTKGLLDSGCTAIAYETICDSAGRLPLLTPMSIIAGRMSIQAGVHYLQKTQGGKGTLLAGAPGTKRAKVVIVGAGVVGMNAARIAIGMGAEVYVFDKSNARLQEIDEKYQTSIHTLYSTEELINHHIQSADLIIGAVLIPGASAPKVITRQMVKQMEPGSVIVDVAIDQGGCLETAKPTTHDNPVYKVDNVIHYCVTNMPGAVSMTSTYALTNSTLPYAIKIANLGWKKALGRDTHFLEGLNTYNGKVTCKAVAEAFKLKYTPASDCV